VFVADLGGHAGEVAGLLFLPNPGGRAVESGLVPDERVVRCASVEAHAGPHEFPLLCALLVAVADDCHHRHDEGDVRRRTSGFRRSLSDFRQDMTSDVAGFAERMDMHPVSDFAGHPQHPRIHRGDIDFGIGLLNRSRAPLRSDEIQVVEVTVMVQLPGSKRREARLHREQVIAQPWTGPFEVHAITPYDVSAHLRTQAEPKIPAGRFLQFPRRSRRHERTTRKSHRDTG
jgi:hypothetical protein